MIPGSANPLLLATAAGAAAYEIPRSVRFNSGDSAYLTRTPASAGNRKTWTVSLWIKRASSARQYVFGTADGSGNNSTWIEFDGDKIRYGDYTSLYIGRLETTQVFRDFSAWGHLVVQMDTTQATASDRMKLYWNGQQITQFSTAIYPAQNTDSQFNTAQAHSFGRGGTYNSFYLSAYLADIHFIDGQALDPTSFGEFDDNNVWQPIDASGLTYGTNGFHLDFADNSSAAALGYDAAGSNDWTVNNLSVTAGAGNDSLRDSPTNGTQTDTGAGGEVVGNYATLNPLNNGGHTLSNGNLDLSTAVSGYKITTSTIGMSSGKWYAEISFTSNSNPTVGIVKQGANLASYVGSDSNGWGLLGNSGTKVTNASQTSYTTAWTTAVIGIAFDADTGTLSFYKDGTSLGTAFTGLTSGPYFIAVGGSNGGSLVANFGQRPFAYQNPGTNRPAATYKALCTANLPAPTIEDGSTAMDVVTYTGTGSALTPTSSLGFSPDLIWIKSRSAATDHSLYDIVRGTQARLESNNTDAEVTSDGGVTAFNSTGFTLGTLAQVNTNAATYVGWCWDGGTSTVSNSDGTITSSVRANASAGISIVGYTGTGVAGTVGHGLGITPGMVIVKSRGNPGTSDAWATYMTGASATAGAYLLLEKTSAVATSSVVFNGTNPTSSVFSIGSWDGTNKNGLAYIAYCFTPVSGFSSFGSYTGNGSADGPFVYTGFRPRWILLKSTGATYFMMYDTARSAYNVTETALYPGLTNTDTTESSNRVDILSNGFKVRSAGGSNPNINPSAGTVVFAAFAENPFSLARAR